MNWKNHLEKKPIHEIEKKLKIKVKLPHVKRNHKRESELLFKHRFLTLLLKLEQKNSRRETTRFFAPFPVSVST